MEPILYDGKGFFEWAKLRYAESSADTWAKRLSYLKANLMDPKAFMDAILNYPAKYGYKATMALAYLKYLTYLKEQKGIELSKDDVGQAVREYRRILKMRERYETRIPRQSTVMAVLSQIRPFSQTRMALELIYHTGLRLKEALGLFWKDVDLDRDFIKVLAEKHGEYGEIPLNETIRALLSTYFIKAKDKVGRLFKIGERTIWKSLSKARRSVGLDDACLVSPKNLRHLYATRLYSRTRDLVLTQRRMRHRTIQATLRYVHLALTDKEYEAVAIPSCEKDNIVEYLKQGWEWIGSTKDFIYLRKPKID